MDAIELAESNPALAEFKRRDLGIRDLAARYMPLKINGLKDRDGFNAVHSARMEVKGVRVGIEKARIAQAIEETRQALVRVRFEAFQGLGQSIPFGLGEMTEESYQAALTAAQLVKAQADAAAAQEALRIAAEKEAARLERIELDRVRAEQDAIRQAQEAKAAELKAHQDRIAEQRRAVELEQAKKEAAERAVRETEARLTAEAEAKRIAVLKQQQDEQKALDEMPWKAKILAIATQIDSISIPAGHPVMLKIEKIITKAASDIRKLSNGSLE